MLAVLSLVLQSGASLAEGLSRVGAVAQHGQFELALRLLILGLLLLDVGVEQVGAGLSLVGCHGLHAVATSLLLGLECRLRVVGAHHHGTLGG